MGKVRLIVLAVILAAYAAPAWCFGVDYDGSANPTTVGWDFAEGVLQGTLFDEGGGNSSWFINDAGNLKTKFMWGTTAGSGTGDIDRGVGAYIEGRVKSVAWGNANIDTDAPLNLGLYIRGTDGALAGHALAIRPDRLLMGSQQSSPTTFMGDFTAYHVYRLVYKYTHLPIRNQYRNTWAVYLDGAEVPVLHTLNANPTSNKPFCTPVWGAGNTGTTQQIYFDYVQYRDTGAYPPGMDGTVLFVDGDPDGTATPDNLAFTISWKTNVPTIGTIHYSPMGDNSFSTVFTDPDPAFKTSHSVTVTGATPGRDYEYYVTSMDASGKQAISLPASITLPSPFFISAGPTSTVSDDLSSVTISWSTSIADATSELHYGTDPSCSTVVVEPGGGGITSHSITVPATGGVKYYYYVKSTNASWPTVQSAVRNFYVTGTVLLNPGFEEGTLDPWVSFGRFDGLFDSGTWAVPAHSGTKWAGSVASYDAKDGGGIYQRVITTPGSYYEAKVFIWCRRSGGGHSGDDACRIGIDPAGGTDPGAATINWSDWSDTAASDIGAGGPWTEIGTVVKSQGTRATVFLQQRQLFSLQWNITGFDDASWGPGPLPPSTIGATRRLKDSWPAELHGKVVTGCFTDPDSLGRFFYIEEADRSAGIRVISETEVSPGDIVSVDGSVRTTMGEKVIVASSVTPVTPPEPTVPAPLGVTQRAIGASFPAPASGCQGLRVKATGRVTYVQANVMYIDDGSGLSDGTDNPVWGTPGAVGLRVMFDPSVWIYAGVGDYVTVTGCAGGYRVAPVAEPPVAAFPVPTIWCSEYEVVPESP